MVAMILLAHSVAAAQLQPTTQEQVDGCIRVLRQGIHPQTNSIDLAVLASLRELGDPSLKALWYQLAQQDRWEAQVHAVLALSELTPENPADPWMISQLRSTDAQRAVIATLLDRKALLPEHSRKLLESGALEPVVELWLLADLVGRGESADPARLHEIIASEDADLAGLAACLLAQLGDPKPLEQHNAKIAALTPAQREVHLMELLIAIEQYRLSATVPWVIATMSQGEVIRQLSWQSVRTLLTLAPEAGVAEWRKRAAQITTDGEWVRAVLLLLDAGASVPAATYGIIPRENELLAAMAQLGEAQSGNQPLAAPLLALIDLGHVGTARWALGRAETLSIDEARTVFFHVIDQLESTRAGRDERAEMAIAATELLYKADPAAALSHLISVEDESLTQEMMLLGLMRCHGKDIGEAVQKLRRIGHSRADSLALILSAKFADKLSEVELKQLGIIASGGGQLTTALQAQAAWLYLKHAGKIDQALTRIFAKG